LHLSAPLVTDSPPFLIDSPTRLYSRAESNALSYYQNLRDGPGFIKTPLRAAPGHLNDSSLAVFQTPRLNRGNLMVGNLQPTGARVDVQGGWTDAGGDYLKLVETSSYTVALMLIGVRDFPEQMGTRAGKSSFSSEAEFEVKWLQKMWNDQTKTLYYQVGIGTDFANDRKILSDHDLWRLPQDDDEYLGDASSLEYIHHRPVFIAGPAGSKISPNLAGRLAADFAECYQVYGSSHPSLADECLVSAEHVFDLADTEWNEDTHLLTTLPWEFYPEQEWRDDLELGAAEIYLALASADRPLPASLPHRAPRPYLIAAAKWANAYMNGPRDGADTLNLYDVSGLAHFELDRALELAGDPDDLEMSRPELLADLKSQLDIAAVAQSKRDPFGFGYMWKGSDSVSHGAGLAIMAMEYDWLTKSSEYATYSDRWSANILGANAWGVSFIAGDGTTFPSCMHDQLSNLAGSLDGASPIHAGALVEGPAAAAATGPLDRMRACPSTGVDAFAQFNGAGSVYKDNVQSYSTNEPAQDLTASSFLMFAWKMTGGPRSRF
jgi:endoglucanase